MKKPKLDWVVDRLKHGQIQNSTDPITKEAADRMAAKMNKNYSWEGEFKARQLKEKQK